MWSKERSTASPHRPRYVDRRTPVAPNLFGALEGLGGDGRRRHRQMGGHVRQDERQHLARVHREVGKRFEILAVKSGETTVRRTAMFRTGYCAKGCRARVGSLTESTARNRNRSTNSKCIATTPRSPRTSRTTLRVFSGDRHEVNDRCSPVFGLPRRLEDQGALSIPPRAALDHRHRLNQPATIGGSSEQRREAGGRIEPRPTQPVDRPGPGST